MGFSKRSMLSKNLYNLKVNFQGYWYGISCDASGNIIKILLIENKLKGKITTELNALTQLLELNIANHATEYEGNALTNAN